MCRFSREKRHVGISPKMKSRLGLVQPITEQEIYAVTVSLMYCAVWMVEQSIITYIRICTEGLLAHTLDTCCKFIISMEIALKSAHRRDQQDGIVLDFNIPPPNVFHLWSFYICTYFATLILRIRLYAELRLTRYRDVVVEDYATLLSF